MEKVTFYRCPHCGNIVFMAHDSGVIPVCCGEQMLPLKANTVEAAVEKHIPVVEHKDGKLHVKVGSVAHPMTEPHYIEFIAIEQNDRIGMAYLPRTGAPEAIFPEIPHGVAYAYCNLHGLWKTEF